MTNTPSAFDRMAGAPLENFMRAPGEVIIDDPAPIPGWVVHPAKAKMDMTRMLAGSAND